MDQQAKAFLQSRIRLHLASNVRSYSWKTWTGAPKHNSLGGISYLTPQEGKVVDKNEDFTVLKLARTEFCVVLNSLLEQQLDVGSTVRLSFYQLRDFNGRLSDGSEDPAVDGVRSYMLTGAMTHLPAVWDARFLHRKEHVTKDWTKIQNPYLWDMVLQLENMASRATGRSLVDILISAKAGKPVFQDPTEDNSWNEDINLRPGMVFAVDCAKLKGKFSLIYDRSMDTYTVITESDDKREVRDDVHFPELPAVFDELLADDSWQNVKVEVLKAAPKPKKVKEAAQA